ncbi:MAG: DUF4255 domain-containing protein [Deltaproteobacteria bacterium]|nr:DUF4255 domain-containing protein [Deltaproteobacteria bacterium]
MIDRALEVLTDSIHSYLEHLPDLGVTTEDVISLTHIVKDNGSVAIDPDSLGMSLINIEEERTLKSMKATVVSDEGIVSHVNPELKLNLFVLIAANFNDYKKGLKYLTGAIRFFQSKNVFTHQNTPDLDGQIEKLIVELHSLGFEQQNHLWGALGAKYLPSVMYKVKLIAIQEGHKADEEPPVRIIESSGKGI